MTMNADTAYEESVELATRLYRGRRLAEMALDGDLGMARVPEADRPAAEAMLAELKEASQAMQAVTRRGPQRRETPLERRYRRYAVKFIVECDGEPTDEALKRVLDSCVLPPPVSEYRAIREQVITQRADLA